MHSYPVNEKSLPIKARPSIIYSVSRPKYGANHNKVGFFCNLAANSVSLTSICVLAGRIPLFPYKPNNTKILNYTNVFITIKNII